MNNVIGPPGAIQTASITVIANEIEVENGSGNEGVNGTWRDANTTGNATMNATKNATMDASVNAIKTGALNKVFRTKAMSIAAHDRPRDRESLKRPW